MSDTFVFTSRLQERHRETLEGLLFFNPQQERFLSGIVDAIDRYGQPEIVTEGGFIRIRVQGVPEVQSLFALEPEGTSDELAGVMIYLRTDVETIKLIHIGAHSDYAATGPRAPQMLVVRMLNQLRSIARRTRGVNRIEILYGLGKIGSIPI